MEVVFLLGSIQSFFFATLFWSRKKIIHAHKVLIVFFLLNGLILADHYLESKSIIFEHPHLLGLTYTLPILIGPILFYYTLILTGRSTSTFKSFFTLHAAPFLILTIYFLFDYYFLRAEEKLQYYYRESQVKTSIPIYIAEFFLICSIPFYSLLSLFHLHRHNKTIKDQFSYKEKIDLRWLQIILYFFSGVSLIMLATNFISDFIPLIPFIYGDHITFGSLTLVIFCIGYFGIKQRAIYPAFANKPKNQYQKSSLKISKDDQRIQQLLHLMEKDQLYLNSKLSLGELAKEMSLSDNHLSQLINDGLDKNFYDFVNAYRVEAVKNKLTDPAFAHLSLLGIALESGFNSKSSFNRAVKKHLGIVPKELKRRS